MPTEPGKTFPVQISFPSRRDRVLFRRAAAVIKTQSPAEYLRDVAYQLIREYEEAFDLPENLDELINRDKERGEYLSNAKKQKRSGR